MPAYVAVHGVQIVQAAPELRKLVVRFPKVPTEDNPRDYVDLDYQVRGWELRLEDTCCCMAEGSSCLISVISTLV